MAPSRGAITVAGGFRALCLRLASAATTLHHLDQLLARSVVSGHRRLAGDPIPSTVLLRRYADLGASPEHLVSLFSSYPHPDIVLLNTLLRALSLSPSPRLAFPLLSRSLALRRPNSCTYASAAACARGDAAAVKAVHALSIVGGFGGDAFVASSLANAYFGLRRPFIARKVFDGVPEPDTVLLNTVLSGMVRAGECLSAVTLFKEMVGNGKVRVDAATLAAVLTASSEVQDLVLGMEVHCAAMKVGLNEHEHVIPGMVSMYSKCGYTACAERVFEEIGEPDLVACNAMISGYSTNGMVDAAVGLFKTLLSSGMKPNSVTMISVVPVYAPFQRDLLAECIHGFAVRSGHVMDSAVSTALTTVYCRLNNMESARRIFDAMPEPTMASWNAMISGYVQNGLTESAVSLFRHMKACNVQPNPVTAASILSASAQLGAISIGRWIHQVIREDELELNVFVMTALIDMYAKCGSLADARSLFDAMGDKNVVTWNVMISGYGLHGHGNDALKLFHDMLGTGILPTRVTLLSVLYACSHGGLIDEGQKVFQSMAEDYSIQPGQEHYACMVDLLGRAGRLNEAYELIVKCPESAGTGVWGALLGACMVHKETRLARLASEKLFELDPENTGYYVLLSNIYCSKKNYTEAAVVRDEAKSRNLVKTPGCTLIEIGNVPHLFTSGDQSHPESQAIYSELEKLTAKIVEAGYRPETDAALYDVEEEEKEQMVKVHSEKLAIAFGLLSTAPGEEIRIIKNLRVCLDCHSATKFISQVTRRLIIVRDSSRFHHFRDGVCSCGDYW